MGTSRTLLCIHRDPAQLHLLAQGGFHLVTATNGSDGLRLLKSHPVDVVVLDYGVGPGNGLGVAEEIKKANPQVPIVLLADREVPVVALESVDALVANSDGSRSLLATVNGLLNAGPARNQAGKLRAQAETGFLHSRKRREPNQRRQNNAVQLAADEKDAPFSATVWRAIRTGTFRF
jgi:DNA-binding response OmpR family regulator